MVCAAQLSRANTSRLCGQRAGTRTSRLDALEAARTEALRELFDRLRIVIEPVAPPREPARASSGMAGILWPPDRPPSGGPGTHAARAARLAGHAASGRQELQATQGRDSTVATDARSGSSAW